MHAYFHRHLVHGHMHTRWSHAVTMMIRWTGRGAKPVELVESWLFTLNLLSLDWGLMHELPPFLAIYHVARRAERMLAQGPCAVPPSKYLLQRS